VVNGAQQKTIPESVQRGGSESAPGIISGSKAGDSQCCSKCFSLGSTGTRAQEQGVELEDEETEQETETETEDEDTENLNTEETQV